MIIFSILIVLSLVLYVYYKVAIVKSNDGLTQAYFNGKSRICLGTLVVSFTINQYILYQTRIALFIGIILIIVGIPQIYRGIKEVKHYRKEWKRLNPS
ncbi:MULTISPECIES: YtpI family protein [Virgibacillus]|uniref:YtpI-like protein n=2 Tax=Virgibacillus TaxID=84406 RepID=A0A024QAL1_9BACI|nr:MULTISPECIES: YtpI family protein [Virgibacillus]EQB35714.1 hypothetical protein M948_11775 [Virgibacillus sp. CM-4]GGJ50299.1 putative membrane protein YtpI [Virgibacillus kapii]CDQ39322.1 hypothetical protein BN990_01617 [Virgibacillus massiliensis]